MSKLNSIVYDLIESPVVTEKSTQALEHNKVTFKVASSAGKQAIKRAVEEIFDVSVVSVNTITTPGKVKRFRGVMGKRKDVKKAIITLKEGDYIDIASKV